MIRLLVYTDGKKEASDALHFAAVLHRRLQAEMSVITVRTGTHASEEPPLIGVPLAPERFSELPPGLQTLLKAAAVLVKEKVLAPIASMTVRDIPQGHLFVCRGAGDQRIPFYECFGGLAETLNKEVDEHQYHLLVAALPRRGKIGRLGDATRKLTLDLHTSLLVVRGGGPDSRWLVCADGSASARRQFPLLQKLLPAVGRPIDLLCVRPPEADPQTLREADECLQKARKWLSGCGKLGNVEMREGRSRIEQILAAAGQESVITLGASLRHDVYRRMVGTLPMRVLERTASSVLLVKQPPEEDIDWMKDPFSCGP